MSYSFKGTVPLCMHGKEVWDRGKTNMHIRITTSSERENLLPLGQTPQHSPGGTTGLSQGGTRHRTAEQSGRAGKER